MKNAKGKLFCIGAAALMILVALMPTGFTRDNNLKLNVPSEKIAYRSNDAPASDLQDDIILNIRGGLYCNISIINNRDEAVMGIFYYSADAIFSDKGTSHEMGWQIEPHEQWYFVCGVPYFAKVFARVSAGEKTLVKEGFSLFWITILLKKSST